MLFFFQKSRFPNVDFGKKIYKILIYQNLACHKVNTYYFICISRHTQMYIELLTI